MKKLNILLITSDQQHFNTIGIRNPEIKTPNLDRLAEEGMLFDRAYCPNPTCTPSRASIITGQYPSQHGAWTLGTKLPESSKTLGDYLTEQGYETALIGKAHFQPLRSTEEYSSLEAYPILQDLDFWKNYKEPFYGFRHIELARNHTFEAHVGQHYALWMEEKGLSNWRDYFVAPTGTLSASTRYHWDIPEEYHYDTWIAERTNAMMEQYVQEEKPFFLWSSFFDPHPEYLLPSPWDTMYENAELTVPHVVEGEHRDSPPIIQKTQEDNPDFSAWKESGFACHGLYSHKHVTQQEARKNMEVYYGMISLMDKYIGKILDKLEEIGIAENTLVIFTSDHGHFFGQHGLHEKGPFMYEDMVKIPMIVRLPGKIPEKKLSDAMQSLVDLAPTILDFCGIKIPGSMTGISQKKVWLGQEKEKRTFTICEDHHEPTTIQLRTYIDKRYKLTVYCKKEYGELYDLEEDPDELHNLWDVEEKRELKQKLLLQALWGEEEREPMWMPRIALA